MAKVLCGNCRKITDYTLRSRVASHEIGGKEIIFREKYAACNECGDEVRLIRYLKKNGWLSKQIRSMFNNITTETTINRVVEKARYGEVVDASGVMAVYPLIVNKTCRKDLTKEDAIKNALLGLSGECGELLDLFKKSFYQGADLDLVHVQLEMGDILYYLYWIAMILDIDMSEIAIANIEKLNSRYPDGFDVQRANNRANGDV